MKINKYLPVAAIYFFFNYLGLPFGLSYTTLLSPFFYFWIVNKRKQEILWPFLLVLTPFVLVQLSYGVNAETYIPALINATGVYIFCQAVYTFLITCKDIHAVFRSLMIINFIICLIGIPLYFTPYSDILWINQFLTQGIAEFTRFKMFAYEASIYATQFTPLFFYFYLRSAFGYTRTPVLLMAAMLILPLVLSFSMGVMGTILLSFGLSGILLFRYLARTRQFWLIGISSVIAVVIILSAVILLFPGNVLFHRLDNIVGGRDISGKGRTSEAFFLGNQILHLKNALFGIGPGQLKLLGTDIIRNFYAYPDDYVITIPNTTAETMMVYGYFGLALRFIAEIFLFFRTRVWTNYYRFGLFLFIFFYQFTGSFVTNIAEFVIWILAFTNCFPEFDVKAKTLINDKIIFHEQIGHPQST